MSHFFGCIALQEKVALAEIASRMKKSMSFYKPDGEGELLTNQVFFLNKYVNTYTPVQETYPIYRNERFILAGICRLDNREQLSAKLHLPLTLNDHEFLLAAYTAWQEKCIEHLTGDFSFVVWDCHKDRLFMAKDHLGIKPLFYLEQDGVLYFSTNITAIKAAFDEPLTLNDRYIAGALKNYPPPVNETFFKNVHRLKPAHYCFFDSTGIQVETKYWELRFLDLSAFKTRQDLFDELYMLFAEAVRCRLRTTKNIGSQLSGGIDSSAIAVITSRLVDKKRLHTFSLVLNDFTRGFSEKKIDEQDTQNEIIDYAGLKRANHHLITDAHYADVHEQIEVSNKVMGGFASVDIIWQDTLFKEAKKYDVGISLSGFPGDECVSYNGNLYYYDYIKHKNIKELAIFLRKFKLQGVRKIINYYRSKRRGTYLSDYKKIQDERNLLKNNTGFDNELKDRSFAFYPTFKELIKNRVCRPHTCLRCESEGAYASQYGIETVYPLADIRLLQFVYSLPVELFKPEPYTRAIFRELCKSILPDKVRLQEKNNGAMTLAYAEYWHKRQFEDFDKVEVLNYHLFDSGKYEQQRNNYKQSNKGLPPLLLHYLSEFIKLNCLNQDF